MRHHIKVFGILLLGITIIIFFLFFEKPSLLSPSPPETEYAQTTLLLLPNPLRTTTSGTIDLVMDTDINTVRFVQIKLSYNPKHLTNITITKGPFMQHAQVLNEFINTDRGTLTYILAIPKGKAVIKGKGILATITFTALLEPDQKTLVVFSKETLITNDTYPGSLLKKAYGTTIIKE